MIHLSAAGESNPRGLIYHAHYFDPDFQSGK